MENLTLRQIIRESIQKYIREIDEAGNVAALEAKMAKTQEAIDARKSKMNMEGLDEAYHEMLDKNKVKELEKEIKHLEKSLAKYEKDLEKLKNKSTKAPVEEKEMVEEMSSEVEGNMENEGQSMENEGQSMEDENLYEMLHMQKLAGILSEEEYTKKVEEARFKKGTDVGKKGKGFNKIAKSAAEKYGSEEAGKKVAGSILKKVLAKDKK